jgi:hypothetical protein
MELFLDTQKIPFFTLRESKFFNGPMWTKIVIFGEDFIEDFYIKF